MSRLIIQNDTGMPMGILFPIIDRIMKRGRVDTHNGQRSYALHTREDIPRVDVFFSVNKASDRCVVQSHDTETGVW